MQGVAQPRVARKTPVIRPSKQLDSVHAAAREIEPNRCTGYTSLWFPCEPGQECGRPTEAFITEPESSPLSRT